MSFSAIILAAVLNGGFESGDGAEFANWTRGRGETAALFRCVAGAGLNGNRGLVWVSTNAPASVNTAISQEIPFERGKLYKLEGFVKTDLRFSDGSARAGAGVCLVWYDAKGRQLGHLYPNKVRGTCDWAVCAGVTKVALPPETAKLVVTAFVLADSKGRAAFDEIAVRPFDFKSVKSAADAPSRYAGLTDFSRYRVCVGSRNRLFVDGKPFFPLGIFVQQHNFAEKKILDRLQEAPFNCVSCLRVMPTRAQLDEFHRRGLMTIYPLRGFYAGTRGAVSGLTKTTDEIAFLTRHLDPIKDHPAILAWSIADESSLSDVPRIAVRRTWLAAYDPHHPTRGIFNRIDIVNEYLPAVDLIGTDIYPIRAEHAVSRAATGTRETVKKTFNSRCILQTAQFFAWQDLQGNNVGAFPTYEEMRAMCWQMIASGANGIEGFAFNMMIDMKTGEKRSGNDGWDSCVKVVREIHAAIPILLSGDEPPVVAGVPKTAVARAYRSGDRVWVLVCNLEPTATDVAFTVGERDVAFTLAAYGVELREVR